MFIREIICEGEVIQGNFPSTQNNDKFEIHAFTPVGSAKPESWVDDNIKDKYELSKKISELMGPPYNFKAENIKVMMNNTFIAMPEFGITNEGMLEFGITENMVKKVAGVGILTALLGAGANAFLNKLPDQQAQAEANAHANLQYQYRQDMRDELRSVSDRAREIAHEMGIPNNPTIDFKSVGRVPVEINGIEVPAFLLTDKEIEQIKKVEKIKAMFKGANEGIDENLRAWFGKGKKGGAGGGGWDRYNTKGERIGKCGDSKKGEGKPKCLSKSRAASLRAKGGKAAIGKAVSKKRRNDPNKNRKGKAKNVSNTVRKKKKED